MTSPLCSLPVFLACIALAACRTTSFPNESILTSRLDPELEKKIEAQMLHKWLQQSKDNSEWAINFILFPSHPVYQIYCGNISVQQASKGQEAAINYSQDNKEKTPTKMIVRGHLFVERKRENAVLDLGFFQIFPWDGKSAYLDVPLDFTYYSSCPEHSQQLEIMNQGNNKEPLPKKRL